MKLSNKVGLSVLILALIGSCRKDSNAHNAYDIILVIGQSNNCNGYDLNNTPTIESPLIKQLGRFGKNDLKIISATDPLDHHSKTINKGGYSLEFSKQYSEIYLKPNRKILIIPCAKIGTGFIDSQWNKGNILYEDAVFRTQYIIKKYPLSKLVTILWHQGESDINNLNYQNELDQFIIDIRGDLGYSEVPFILGGMVPFWVKQNQNRVKTQQIIKNTPNRLIKTGYANPTYPFTIEKANNSIDSIHYSAKGLRELGNRYFSSFINLK